MLKILFFTVALAVFCFIALPNIFFTSSLANKSSISAPKEVKEFNKAKDEQNSEIKKFESPIYFTIFKFILNCNPFKSSEKVSDNLKEEKPTKKKIIFSQLRPRKLV